MKIPISIEGQRGKFESQELPDSEVPAIVGLKGMEANQIMLIPHHNRVIIPNGGKVEIKISKEVQIVECIRTDSGHLLLPCDQWSHKSKHKSTMASASKIGEKRFGQRSPRPPF